jgi:hypothetical protein
MSRSRAETADLICPTCGQPFQAEVWLVIDRAERPDLVHLLMDGDLNVTACPHCGAEGGLNHPLLLHDPTRKELLCALPLSVKGAETARAMVGDLLQGLLEALPEEQRLPYLAEVEVVPELDGLRAALIEQALAEDASSADRLLGIALEELLNVANEADFQRVVAEHRQLLLDPGAQDALDQIVRAARSTDDRELLRRAREAKAVLSRMRVTLTARRQTLAALLDSLAPLSDTEVMLVPHLRRMLDAVEPQDVYAARIGLEPAEQARLDTLIERLAERAEAEGQPEAFAFVRHLQALPRQ